MPFLSNISSKFVYRFTVRMAKCCYEVMAAQCPSWNYYSGFSTGTTFMPQLTSTGRNKIEWPFFKRQKGHCEYPVLFQNLMRAVFTQSQWVRKNDSLTAPVTTLLNIHSGFVLPPFSTMLEEAFQHERYRTDSKSKKCKRMSNISETVWKGCPLKVSLSGEIYLLKL